MLITCFPCKIVGGLIGCINKLSQKMLVKDSANTASAVPEDEVDNEGLKVNDT